LYSGPWKGALCRRIMPVMEDQSRNGHVHVNGRYVLVERESALPAVPRVRRRYSLARVAPSPRSALGEDRHERLERVAEQSPGNA